MEDISLILGVSPNTVRDYKKRYPELSAAYKRGKSKGHLEVTNRLRDQIKDGNVTAMIFYLKTQCRWRDRTRVELSGPGEQPVQVAGAFSGLSKQGADDIRRKILGIEPDDEGE
jgi:hypothetical protein